MDEIDFFSLSFFPDLLSDMKERGGESDDANLDHIDIGAAADTRTKWSRKGV